MYPEDLKKVFDKAVNDSIVQIPAISSAFQVGELDLKAHIDNEMDFYLGCVIATIFEKYMVYATNAGFPQEQIISTSLLAANNIFQMIQTLKEKLKIRLGYNNKHAQINFSSIII